MIHRVRRVLVVVPAHNEAERIEECLTALTRAAGLVRIPVQILVVCDDCDDQTESICAAASVTAVAITSRCVGTARRVGAEILLSPDPRPEEAWIANTDADTIVPVTWIRDQLELAGQGADVVVGTVQLSMVQSVRLARAFATDYSSGLRPDGTHVHVHGANLGVHAAAYRAVGGFAQLKNHEDLDLVSRLQAAGYEIQRPGWLRVKTSGRLTGRCTNGFAGRLAKL